MCLDKVDKEPKVSRNYGYKVFFKGSYELLSAIQTGSYPVGEWVEDRFRGSVGFPPVQYRTGFHIYATMKGLSSQWCCGDFRTIRRVEFQDVVATGKQAGVKVIVARKMKIGEKEYEKTTCIPDKKSI